MNVVSKFKYRGATYEATFSKKPKFGNSPTQYVLNKIEPYLIIEIHVYEFDDVRKTLVYGMVPENTELALLVLRGIKSGCRRLEIPIN